MADDAREALEDLFKSLQEREAEELVEDIKLVISRGVTREAEFEGRAKELTQTPLESEEAYLIAVDLVLASMEPVLMRKSMKEELSLADNRNINIDWKQDFVENSPIKPREFQGVFLPVIEPRELDEFEKDLKDLLTLLQGA